LRDTFEGELLGFNLAHLLDSVVAAKCQDFISLQVEHAPALQPATAWAEEQTGAKCFRDDWPEHGHDGLIFTGMEINIMWFEIRRKDNDWFTAGNATVITSLTACLGFIFRLCAVRPEGKSSPGASQEQSFSSAEAASSALIAALKNDDKPSLMRILGPQATDIFLCRDETGDKDDRELLVARYQQTHRFVIEPNGTTTLCVGADNWPTPIPLVSKDNRWHFDLEAGKQEILYRRIGENELAVIQVCHQMVGALTEYFSPQGDDASIGQFPQEILSNPGKHNGLFWKRSIGDARRPRGSIVALADSQDYAQDANEQQQSFHGYYFHLLKDHGHFTAHASRSYRIHSKQTRDFAFVAYPAEYRSSGVMTFLVDQDGVVYEKDLGRRTAAIAKSLSRDDRDATWGKTESMLSR